MNWEYRVEETTQDTVENILSDAGSKGWELVTAYTLGFDEERRSVISLIFKRPIT